MMLNLSAAHLEVGGVLGGLGTRLDGEGRRGRGEGTGTPGTARTLPLPLP